MEWYGISKSNKTETETELLLKYKQGSLYISSGMAAAWSAAKRVGSLGAARVGIIKKL